VGDVFGADDADEQAVVDDECEPARAMAGATSAMGRVASTTATQLAGRAVRARGMWARLAGGTRLRSAKRTTPAGGVAERERPVSGVDGDGTHEVVDVLLRVSVPYTVLSCMVARTGIRPSRAW